MRLFITMALLATAAAYGQVVGQNAQPTESDTAYTVSVSSTLIVEAVNVRDKQGNPIKGLTSKDFIVSEDGATQQVTFCEYQELPVAGHAAPPKSLPPENIPIYDRLTVTQIAPESPGSLKYKDHRLIAMYFDLTVLAPEDKWRALGAAQQFIRTEMTSADLVAIMRYGGSSVDVLQDFTDDRTRLLSILQTLMVGEHQISEEITEGPSSADTGAAFGQDSAEFNLFNTDRQLSALQTAAKQLGRLSEKKVLIYFGSGLTLHGVDNQAQLHATINDAIRSGVSLWPIDARGLVAEAPLGDASQGSPGNAAMYTGVAALAMATQLQQSQDTMYTLAEDTGGKALLDDNNLTHGIVRAQQTVTSYYLLGYYTSNRALDGRYRHITINIKPQLNATLDYRRGYYAGKQFLKFTHADKERQLEDALMLPNPITELTLAMELNYFQLNRAEYFVPVVVKIPGRELALAKNRGAQRTLIDFLLEVKDELDNNTTVQSMRDNIDIKLSNETAAELSTRIIEYDTGFTLLPGKYSIILLARDDETGRIGTFQTSFVIPNLSKETKRVAISSVVLSGQRLDLKNAIYNASTRKERSKEETNNPLVSYGQKLIPSVTRVFSKRRDLYVYLQAYEPGVMNVQPLIAFVDFYQGQHKVFETEPVEITSGTNNIVKTMPIRFNIGLTPLAPGDYDLQVAVLNPTTQQTAFWRAPITLVP